MEDKLNAYIKILELELLNAETDFIINSLEDEDKSKHLVIRVGQIKYALSILYSIKKEAK